MKKHKGTAAFKAEKIIEDDRLFLLMDSQYFETWKCKGSSGHVYDVSYNKLSKKFNCTCKNIRMIDCSHIIAVRRTRNGLVESVQEKEVYA